MRSARSELDRAAMSIVLVGASVKVGRTKMSLLELRQRFLEGCLDDWFVRHMFVVCCLLQSSFRFGWKRQKWKNEDEERVEC